MKRRANVGFTMIQTLVVVAIIGVLSAISIPVFTNTMNSYRLNAAVSAAKGAISATRMQAIMHGCEYEVVFTLSSMSYQTFSEVPSTAGTVGCLTSFSNGTTAIPLPDWQLAMEVYTCSVPLTNWSCTPSTDLLASSSTTVTYTFFPNGTVTVSPASAGMRVANTIQSNTIWISGVGDVETSSP